MLLKFSSVMVCDAIASSSLFFFFFFFSLFLVIKGVRPRVRGSHISLLFVLHTVKIFKKKKLFILKSLNFILINKELLKTKNTNKHDH